MIKDFGIFHPYENAQATGHMKKAMFLKSEDGQDWYELLKTLVKHDPLTGDFIEAQHPQYVLLDLDNSVVATHRDASMFYPYDNRLVATDIQDVAVGMVLVDDQFKQAPKTVVVPTSVTMRQARLALLDKKLLDKTEQALADMEDEAGQRARIDWQYGSHVTRKGDLIDAINGALKLTDKQLDALFVHAATL